MKPVEYVCIPGDFWVEMAATVAVNAPMVKKLVEYVCIPGGIWVEMAAAVAVNEPMTN